jgi:DNA polymerase delta subunit 1
LTLIDQFLVQLYCSLGPVPIVRLFGVTPEGHSVLANIHGVTPYLYAALSGLPTDLPDNALAALRTVLDERMKEKARGEEKSLKSFVLGIERTEPMQSLVGFHGDEKRRFVKVSLATIH